MKTNLVKKAIKERARTKYVTLSDREIEEYFEAAMQAVGAEDVFTKDRMNKTITQGKKKRKVYFYESFSEGDILSQYLKERIDSLFDIKFASRNRIMTLLFNYISTLKDINDFVVIRVDFHSFFDSVQTKRVYEKYLLKSLLTREEKQLLKKYVDANEYCYAGLSLSNSLVELISRDFDKVLKAKLYKYGAFFYERYVDDIIILLNSFIDKEKFLNIAKETIEEVFGSTDVYFSENSDKFAYYARREFKNYMSEGFSYLGYQFTFITKKYSETKDIMLQYGITKKKIARYTGMLDMAFASYRKNNNMELLRQRIKIFSSRVVVSKTVRSNENDWLVKGVVGNYKELRYHLNSLDEDTQSFLNGVIVDMCEKYGLGRPYFIKQEGEESIYNIYSNMKRNRTIIFDDRNGVLGETVLAWIDKINPGYRRTYSTSEKKYYEIVRDYLGMLKI